MEPVFRTPEIVRAVYLGVVFIVGKPRVLVGARVCLAGLGGGVEADKMATDLTQKYTSKTQQQLV